MRLFIAVPLSDATRDRILKLEDLIRSDCRGNFTLRQNLHITLEFLGEVPPARLPELRKVLSSLPTASFSLTVGSKIGHFGDLWWLSVQSSGLVKLQSVLHRELLQQGFRLESKPFRPHLTLVRRLEGTLPFSFSEFGSVFPPVTETVSEVILYESSRIGGRLTYTPLEVKKLQ